MRNLFNIAFGSPLEVRPEFGKLPIITMAGLFLFLTLGVHHG